MTTKYNVPVPTASAEHPSMPSCSKETDPHIVKTAHIGQHSLPIGVHDAGFKTGTQCVTRYLNTP